jgi:hypothetical protein
VARDSKTAQDSPEEPPGFDALVSLMEEVSGVVRGHVPSTTSLLDGAVVDMAALPADAQLRMMEFGQAMLAWANEHGIEPQQAMLLVGREFTRRVEAAGRMAPDAVGRQSEIEEASNDAFAGGMRRRQLSNWPACFCDDCVAKARSAGEL